ncbi:hypothetical protein Neuguinea78_02440 [Helicobacter pylori]
MAYRYDSDLEFLKQLGSNDLKDLFDVLIYDEYGAPRMSEELLKIQQNTKHMVVITLNTPKGSPKNYSVMGAIVLRICLETKGFYTKKFCAMCAII